MEKRFNISADCKPAVHYMVDMGERLVKIKEMVDRRDYFIINRARQYGKTTMLKALSQFLKEDYVVASLDFQMMSESKFSNENTFSLTFAKMFIKALETEAVREDGIVNIALNSLKRALQERRDEIELFELFEYLSDICKDSPKPLVLMIDEVDSAANNQIFMDFLAQIRGYYINRDVMPTFWSVILAGVYDIKNIKYKIRQDAEHKLNSPWNIAVEFLVEMSFSAEDIAGMLEEYERDYETGMDITEISGLIYDYTSGYPFLVSRICKLVDERIAGSEDYPDRKSAWTGQGVREAVKVLLTEPNTLFDSLINKLEDYPELDEMLRELLFKGKEIVYVVGVRSVEAALMFGFVKRSNNLIFVANRIFETLLYNYFLASPAMRQDGIYEAAIKDKNQFVSDISCYI